MKPKGLALLFAGCKVPISEMEQLMTDMVKDELTDLYDRDFCEYLIGYIIASDFLKPLDDIYKEYLENYEKD